MTAVPTIRVRGLTVYTHHGVGEAERETGQRMIFDLDLVPLSCGAVTSDNVADTIDYGEVATLVAEVATGRSCRTLERLVTVIAETVLERFPGIASATVRATKPVPPVPLTVDGVSVEITRSRAGGR